VFSSRPLAGEKHNQSSRSSAHAIAHAVEIVTVVFLEPISKRNHRINLAIPAIDATMMPNSTTVS
jgi:hypothetical protein